jgi:hypothetical protein
MDGIYHCGQRSRWLREVLVVDEETVSSDDFAKPSNDQILSTSPSSLCSPQCLLLLSQRNNKRLSLTTPKLQLLQQMTPTALPSLEARRQRTSAKLGEDVIGDEDDDVMGEEEEAKRQAHAKAAKAASENKAATKAKAATGEGDDSIKGGDASEATEGGDKTASTKPKPKQKNRFILFVGAYPCPSCPPSSRRSFVAA